MCDGSSQDLVYLPPYLPTYLTIEVQSQDPSVPPNVQDKVVAQQKQSKNNSPEQTPDGGEKLVKIHMIPAGTEWITSTFARADLARQLRTMSAWH